MPLNNIQFRAEIGNFNNALHRIVVSKYASVIDYIYMATINISFVHAGFSLDNFILHVVSIFAVIIILPIIILFSKPSNIIKSCKRVYVYIYILIQFIYNIIRHTMIYPMIIVRLVSHYLIRYLFFFQICAFFPYLKIMLMICGDIKSNPGPTDVGDHNLSICHWNLNGLATNSFFKLSLLEAYNSVHDFDIICISETFLNSEISSDDPSLIIQGYTMARSDHPSNTKRGGVCIFYKEHLPFVIRTDIAHLEECLIGEIKIKNSKCFVTCLYRSPSQTADEIDNLYLYGFERICDSIALESPFCSFIVGDLNAKCTNWWTRGANNLCGTELYNLSTLLGYSQIIKDPTNFEPNKNPTCIDLIFTSQPNLVFESGVHPSLCRTCHHQIIYAKICFKVHSPPSYKREVWHYNRARVDLIKRRKL